MIAALVIAIVSSSNVNISDRQVTIPEFTTLDQTNFNTLGNPDAPVVIEEFSDFGCSHCADFALTTKKLIEEEYINTGQVYLVFHSVGSFLNAPSTLQAAEAAYCAGDQDAFWSFHDLIFANQVQLFSNRSADISKSMETFAEILDLDVEGFNTCLADRKYRELAAADELKTRENNITGTPAFLINGVLYSGNQPYQNFQQAIDQILASQ